MHCLMADANDKGEKAVGIEVRVLVNFLWFVF